MKLALLGIFLALPVTFIGCAASNPATATAPNSPQTQALNVTKTLADAINTAVKTAIAYRNNACASPSAQCAAATATTNTIENWAKSAAILDDSVATELGSADPWTAQKTKIIALLPQFKIPGTSTTDATIQAALNAVSALLTQLQGALQ